MSGINFWAPKTKITTQNHNNNQQKHSLLSYWSFWIWRNGYKNFWKVFKFIPPKVISNQERFCSVFFRKASDVGSFESLTHQISLISHQIQMVQNNVVLQLPITFLFATVPKKLQHTSYFLTHLLMPNLSVCARFGSFQTPRKSFPRQQT